MTKTDLADAVYRRHGGISRRESADIVDRLLGRIKDELGRDRDVRISGFGNFQVVQRKPRRGRNPQTGEAIPIGARRALVFRPSRSLVDRLN